MTPPILFEDEDLIAVDKPEGMAVIPERTRTSPCLMEVLAAARSGTRLFVVHRIDKDVSGVVLVAKSAEVHRALNRQFETRQVRKTYLGVVHGRLAASSGRIAAPIRQFGSSRMGVDRHRGKPCLTLYRVIEREGEFTQVGIQPVTGRRHQIRVHFHHLGHPIVGDPKYGDPDLRRAYPRLLLHARSISFRLGGGRPVRITAPLPASFTDLAARLAKGAPAPPARRGADDAPTARPAAVRSATERSAWAGSPPDVPGGVRCRAMAPGESATVAALARRVFATCVAPRCARAGRRAFLAYARPVRIRERLHRDHRVLVAEQDGRLAGMMEVRGAGHIAMLFVERRAQRRGVARALIAAAFPPERPGVPITVNATPGSVAAYARLGFVATGPVRTTDGLRVVPMERSAGGGPGPAGGPSASARPMVSSRATR